MNRKGILFLSVFTIPFRNSPIVGADLGVGKDFLSTIEAEPKKKES